HLGAGGRQQGERGQDALAVEVGVPPDGELHQIDRRVRDRRRAPGAVGELVGAQAQQVLPGFLLAAGLGVVGAVVAFHAAEHAESTKRCQHFVERVGTVIVPLAAAEPATCGGKAGTLGALLRAGFPVPDGFVVPHTAQDGPGLTEALARALDRLGDPPVAVRSSAAHEGGHERSAAGAHDSFLAVRGAQAVAAAVRACRASLRSPRLLVRASGAMAVLVQRHVDAEVSGVMFTTDPVRIEASWGLGPSVVGGTVTPDSYLVGGDAVTGGT